MLFGLECQNNDCVHDSILSYRLRFSLMPDKECTSCHRGQPVPIDQAARRLGVDLENADKDQAEMCKHWYECPAQPPHIEPWRRQLQSERNDMVFKAHQLESAKAQMVLLGIEEPQVGVNTAEGHRSIPPGFDARVLLMKEEPLRRIAVYMRWRPETGEVLTNEMCYQGFFTRGMTANERKQAQARRLLPDEFEEIYRGVRPSIDSETRKMVGDSITVTKLTCQHCTRALPLRTFNTLSLRECEFGD